MIIPDKPDVQDPQVPTVRSDASQFSDSKSVMSQEPPPYSEASSSLLSGPPPEVVASSSRAAPSNYPPVGHPAHPHSQSSQLLVPANTRSRTRSFGDGQGPSNQVPLSKTRSQNDSRAIPQPNHNKPHPNLPDGLQQPPAAPQTAVALRVPQRRPHSLPGPAVSPRSSSMPSPASPSHPTTEPIPPQHCNYLLERNDRSSVKGTWYLDTTLHIPEPLRPPMSKFSGTWNEMDKKSVKQREREKKKREGGGWGRKKVVDTTPPKPLANEGVMPNLMLYSKDGGVQAEVHVVSGGRDMAVIVAECQDGSIKLAVNATEYQPMRIFARSMDGSVRVRIPTNFEGAISLTTEDGSVNISEGVKARLMMFSSTNKATRAYIGNWQAANFDSPKSTSPSSPPQDPETTDPFKAWTGPLVQLYARDGSVHISYIGEDTSSTFSKVMKTIKEGFLGTGGIDEESGHGQGGTSSSPPPTMLLPRGAAMQAYRALPASYLQAQQHLHSHSHHPPHPASHAHSYSQPGAGRPVPQAQARQNAALPGPDGPSLFQDPRDRRMHDQKTSQ